MLPGAVVDFSTVNDLRGFLLSFRKPLLSMIGPINFWACVRVNSVNNAVMTCLFSCVI